MADGKVVQLTPTAMASNGRAVAREPSGRAVFVENALPGERVMVRIESEHPRHATAGVEEVLEDSPDRVAPPCPHVAEGCGGCQWQHVNLPAQHRYKEQIVSDALRRLGRIDPPLPTPTVALEPWSYRTTLRAGVVGGRIGLRRMRSNDLVGIDGCLIVHPLLQDLVSGSRYRPGTEVILRCGARTGDRLVSTRPANGGIDLPADVRSDRFTERAAGRIWEVSARSFFQTRADGVDALAALVSNAAGELAEVTGGPSTALDLYSGVGLFAGVLADQGWSVTAVEGSTAAVADARRNLECLPVSVHRADVARWCAASVDLVVADPSRDGLGRAGVAVVAASGARRLVLVSCDAGSLGRDAGLLTEAGYRMASVRLIDLFPHTFHVEVVSVFDRT